MVRITSFVLFVLTCGVGLAWGQASSTSSQNRPAGQIASQVTPEAVPVIPAKDGENSHIRIVCRLCNLPANNAAATLQNLFRAEGDKSTTKALNDKVAIVPDSITNCLLISGPPSAVDEVRRLLSQLDRPVAMVRLEVQITELALDQVKKAPDAALAEGKSASDELSKKTADKSGDSELVVYAEVTTLDNQSAYIKTGRTEGHVTGVSQSPAGRNNAISNTNVGSSINMTPRVSPDGTVALQLDIQDSRSGPMDEGVLISELNGRQVRSPNVETLQNQTTLRLKDDQPMVISGTTSYGKTRKIIVTAHVVYPGGGKKAE